MSARHFLSGAAVGAGLVYFFDPDQGTARRARARLRGATPAVRYGARLGDLEGLEAANLAGGGARSNLGRLARIAAGALATYGLARRGRSGALLRTLGLGIAAAVPRRPAQTLGERRRTVDIQKTLHVDAPVDRVYAFWSTYENYPLFMANVREVQDLGGGRSRWLLTGPGRQPLQWDAVLTGREESALLAWRSEPGSILDHAGAIRFAPEAGGTRIDLRFCYHPPAGRASRAVADFFGGDPRARLNDDLARLKSLLETTIRSDSHGQEPRS
ncbi:MAG: SRPBCC family protein [Gemmatimonadales bacterium]